MSAPPTQGQIAAARARLSGVARETPLLTHPELDRIAGRKVLVKAESLQRTGSFKFRGGFNAAATAPAGTRHIVAMSSGNHAQGVALAAQLHGIDATIVMPSDAPQSKVDGTKSYGAAVVPFDRALGNRDEVAAAVLAERPGHFIHPFDNPDVIAGQATAGLEIMAQAAAFGVTQADIAVCAGGGGLAAGTALAVAGSGFRVRTAEPEGFDDMARSLALGHRVPNNQTSGSICDAVLTQIPGEITFPVLNSHAGPGLVMSDTDALRAAALAFAHLRLVLEPGGALALAAALFQPEAFRGDAVVAIATGGNVDASMFQQVLAHVP